MSGVAHPAPPGTRPEPTSTAELGRLVFDLARAGDTVALVELVDCGIPVGLRDAAGNSLLMMAAYHGRARTVAALAARGADVDRENDLGQTPLAGAVFKGHDEVIDLLLELGASAYRGTPTAVAAAIAFGRPDLERRLRGLPAPAADDAGEDA